MVIFPLYGRRHTCRFDEQIRPHLAVLYRYAYRLTSSQHDAEDLVQELLFQLYRKGLDIEPLDNSQTWLLKVLYRQFIDWQRKAKRSPTHLSDDNAELYLASLSNDKDSPEYALQQNQLQGELMRALNLLNEEQRVVVMLHDVEGVTLQELVEVLDVPLGTLKSRLHRARRQLRSLLLATGEPFDGGLRVIKRE